MTFTGEPIEGCSAFSSDRKKTLLNPAGKPGTDTAVGDAEGAAEFFQLTDGVFSASETEDEAVDDVALCYLCHNIISIIIKL